MVRFSENKDLIKDMGVKGREEAFKYFDVSYMVEEYCKLYRELLLKKRKT